MATTPMQTLGTQCTHHDGVIHQMYQQTKNIQNELKAMELSVAVYLAAGPYDDLVQRINDHFKFLHDESKAMFDSLDLSSIIQNKEELRMVIDGLLIKLNDMQKEFDEGNSDGDFNRDLLGTIQTDLDEYEIYLDFLMRGPVL